MELAFLNPVVERPGPWASVYFDTSRASQYAFKEQELAAREACDELAAQGADERTCRTLRDVLSELPRTGAPGRALFATGGEVVLDVPLGEAPQGRSEVSWSPVPHLGPLLEHRSENPRCLIAYIDRKGADFEVRDDYGREEAGHQEGQDWPIHRNRHGADWSVRHFELAVEETWDHNAGEIAKALAETWEETGARMLVLAGDVRERRAVHDRLPEPLKSACTETEYGGRAAGARRERLDEVVDEAREKYVRQHTAELLDRFRSRRAQVPGDVPHDAAEGVPALVEAAREHRIGSLVIRPDGPDVHREVWVGREPDQIAVRHTDIPYLGDTEPVAVRADDALLRAAAASGAEAVVVHRPEDVDGDLPSGGLGALLRWPSARGERLEESL
ncbi:Vms1/Ankzf1 family peptidyl-tRNA hydrolase [Streptomyces xinghaiensis]|uniref:baeRF2 domain-containing protein n=1 Tax=Streptomyces xinghaiensis TaxID=1038928 RepID=UPI0002FF56FB|nr:Vms1/Ankzf1 family peptidyl-tRNA hydrolase [Streptomyces xinghaiensis]MZE79822.1 hypothetical protein [Streptomyces sp. SID5475]